MIKSEIDLDFVETDDDSTSQLCKCQFCKDSVIYFYHHKRWITDSYHVHNSDHTFHRCCRPTSWSKVASIPDGWEYQRSDYDDDAGCFIAKKYSLFEKFENSDLELIMCGF
jgi:hypothetical protein